MAKVSLLGSLAVGVKLRSIYAYSAPCSALKFKVPLVALVKGPAGPTPAQLVKSLSAGPFALVTIFHSTVPVEGPSSTEGWAMLYWVVQLTSALT